MQTTELPSTSERQPATKPMEFDDPPNGGYGWVCTIAAAVIVAHSWGFNSAYAVFLAYYIDSDKLGRHSRFEYALVGSLSLTTTFLIAPITTLLVRKHGIKKPLLVGVILETISFFMASLATKVWQLALTQGVLFGLGLGLLFVPLAALIPQWFTTKRSLASGVFVSGAGLGGAVYSVATGAMIRNLGIVWAFRILGILAFSINTVCVLLVKDRATSYARPEESVIGLKFLKNKAYLLLLGFSCFTILGYFVLLYTLANYAKEIGLTASRAALVSTLFNVGQAIGRPLIGYFSDSMGRVNMAGATTFVAGVLALTVWVNAHSFGLLIFFAISEGLVAGNFWVNIAPLISDVIGVQEVASGLNLMWLSIVVPATFSEALALEVVAETKSYLGTQLLTGFLYMAAAACLGILRVMMIRRQPHVTDKPHYLRCNPPEETLGARTTGSSMKSGRKTIFQAAFARVKV